MYRFIYLCKHHHNQDREHRHFSGCPVVKIPSYNAGAVGSIPSWGTKIPHTTQSRKRGEDGPGATHVKNPPANTGNIRDMSSIPGSGRSSGGGHANPLQHSCLENPLDRGARWATVHGVTKNRTQLSTKMARPSQMPFCHPLAG